MYEYRVNIERIIDGDTVDVLIDLGFSIYIKDRVRIADIDTPELNSSDTVEREYAGKAKVRVKELLQINRKFVMISKKYDPRDRYGRILADFRLPGGGLLSETLLQERLAVPYKSGQTWEERRVLHEANWKELQYGK